MHKDFINKISSNKCSKCGGDTPGWKCPKCGSVSNLFDPTTPTKVPFRHQIPSTMP